MVQPDFNSALASHNVSLRIPTPTFGGGLIDNIADETILANKNANWTFKAAGIRNTPENHLVFEQNSGNGDMTSGMQNFATFMRLLAPPTPAADTASTLNGRLLFTTPAAHSAARRHS